MMFGTPISDAIDAMNKMLPCFLETIPGSTARVR
jgi:hypothetical protein